MVVRNDAKRIEKVPLIVVEPPVATKHSTDQRRKRPTPEQTWLCSSRQDNHDIGYSFAIYPLIWGQRHSLQGFPKTTHDAVIIQASVTLEIELGRECLPSRRR